MRIDSEGILPERPDFSEDDIEACTSSGDFRPMLFEWYKYVGQLCRAEAYLSRRSPAFRCIPPVHYAVLIGLLNRCSRLMLAVVCLSSTELYGETTQLLGRCIAESAIKIHWLCRRDDPERFKQYLADGLRRDLLLKQQIEEKVKNRGGNTLKAEKSMMRSIERVVELSGLSEQEIGATKRLPDLRSVYDDLQLGDLAYISIQRMGSHAVHGTWTDLTCNYLRQGKDGEFYVQDHDVDTAAEQYEIVAVLVLNAIGAFLRYVIADPAEVGDLLLDLEEIKAEIIALVSDSLNPHDYDEFHM